MARYSKQFIAEIKSRLRVSEVVSKYVKLTQRGSEYVGLSPFKTEKTPSFTVNDEKDFFHCFSSAEHGDIFTFLMKHKNMSYPEAIETLARQAGLNPDNGLIKGTNFVKNNHQLLREIMSDASKFFYNNLLNDKPARNYLVKRIVNENTISKFSVGYSSKKSDDLFFYLKQKGYEINDMISLGLIKKSKDNNGYYDFFRNRLMFPIRDYRSNIIAFGGRAMDNSPIKYINSSDNPIFKKSFQLYNIDFAIEENRKVKDLIIVEGYMDVISLYQNNFKATVAPLGTALTIYQLERAWKISDSPIILFDGDEAGRKAAIRASILALNNLQPDRSLRFCLLPNDMDPDDYIKTYGVSDLKNLLTDSIELSEFIWQTEINKEELITPEKKAGFEKRVRFLINQIKNESVKQYYVSEFNLRIKNYKFGNTINGSKIKNFNKHGISKEISKSERVSKNSHDSIIREKIIILILLENPFLLEKYPEELGQLTFNEENMNKLVTGLLEFSSQNFDKDLEKLSLRSYLENRGFIKIINYLYNPSLLETYREMINNNQDIIEKNFLEMVNVHKIILNKNSLSEAYLDFEQKMDDESYNNFLKMKKETLKD